MDNDNIKDPEGIEKRFELHQKRMDNISVLEWHILEHKKEREHPYRQLSQIIAPHKRRLFKNFHWRRIRNLIILSLKEVGIEEETIAKIFNLSSRSVSRVREKIDMFKLQKANGRKESRTRA